MIMKINGAKIKINNTDMCRTTTSSGRPVHTFHGDDFQKFSPADIETLKREGAFCLEVHTRRKTITIYYL